jgi:hypothetical protein
MDEISFTLSFKLLNNIIKIEYVTFKNRNVLLYIMCNDS